MWRARVLVCSVACVCGACVHVWRVCMPGVMCGVVWCGVCACVCKCVPLDVRATVGAFACAGVGVVGWVSGG